MLLMDFPFIFIKLNDYFPNYEKIIGNLIIKENYATDIMHIIH